VRVLLNALVACVCAVHTLSAQTHTLIVLSHSNHTVYELDPSSGRVLHEFVAPEQPHEGAVTADGATIFASVPAASIVEILDGTTLKENGRINSDFFRRLDGKSSSPHGMALTTDNSKLYIGVENADVPGVVVYDVKAGKIVRKIDLLLRGGHYLQIQPGTDKLYYPHRNDNRVVVIDTKSDRIVKIIPVEGGPVGVAFAPNGEVWLHEDGDGSVTVVDSKTDEVVKVIPTGGRGAGRMAVSPDGRFAASTHSDSADVAIIDTATRAVAATVKIGKGPGFPMFSPDSLRLYVLNSGMGDVAVIDLKTMAVAARHKVGTDPFGGGLRATAR
jgi:YVTN family beta-propeller protein